MHGTHGGKKNVFWLSAICKSGSITYLDVMLLYEETWDKVT